MIKSWSPSKLDKYEQCPLWCKLETEDKLCPLCFKGRTQGGFGKPVVCVGGCEKITPEAPALARGTRINVMLDEYVMGVTPAIHSEIAPVTKWLVNFRDAFAGNKLRVQLQLAYNAAWEPTEWFARDAWLRVALDVLYLRTQTQWEVIDWKTGKMHLNDKYQDQMSIYNVAVMTTFGPPRAVTSSLVYVDAGQSVPGPRLMRGSLAKEQKRWTSRVKKMLTDEKFPPKMGIQCRWCRYSKTKGGPCPIA